MMARRTVKRQVHTLSSRSTSSSSQLNDRLKTLQAERIADQEAANRLQNTIDAISRKQRELIKQKNQIDYRKLRRGSARSRRRRAAQMIAKLETQIRDLAKKKFRLRKGRNPGDISRKRGSVSSIQEVKAEMERKARINKAVSSLKRKISSGKGTISSKTTLPGGESVIVNRAGLVTVKRGNKIVEQEVRPFNFKQRALTKSELALGRKFDEKSQREFKRILQLREPETLKKEQRFLKAQSSRSKQLADRRRRKTAKEKGVLLIVNSPTGGTVQMRKADLEKAGFDVPSFLALAKKKEQKASGISSAKRFDVVNERTFSQKALSALSRVGLSISPEKLEKLKADLTLRDFRPKNLKEFSIPLVLLAAGTIKLAQTVGSAERKRGRAQFATSLTFIGKVRGAGRQVAGTALEFLPTAPLAFGLGGAAGLALRTRWGTQAIVAAAPTLMAANIIGVVEDAKNRGIISAVTQEVLEDIFIGAGTLMTQFKLNPSAPSKTFDKGLKKIDSKVKKSELKDAYILYEKGWVNINKNHKKITPSASAKLKKNIKDLATLRRSIKTRGLIKGTAKHKLNKTNEAIKETIIKSKKALKQAKGNQRIRLKAKIKKLEDNLFILKRDIKRRPKNLTQKIEKLHSSLKNTLNSIKPTNLARKSKLSSEKLKFNSIRGLIRLESKVKNMSSSISTVKNRKVNKLKIRINRLLERISEIKVSLNIKENLSISKIKSLIKSAGAKLNDTLMKKINNLNLEFNRLLRRTEQFVAKVPKATTIARDKIRNVPSTIKRFSRKRIDQAMVDINIFVTKNSNLLNQLKASPRSVQLKIKKLKKDANTLKKELKLKLRRKNAIVGQAFANKYHSLVLRFNRLVEGVKKTPSNLKKTVSEELERLSVLSKIYSETFKSSFIALNMRSARQIKSLISRSSKDLDARVKSLKRRLSLKTLTDEKLFKINEEIKSISVSLSSGSAYPVSGPFLIKLRSGKTISFRSKKELLNFIKRLPEVKKRPKNMKATLKKLNSRLKKESLAARKKLYLESAKDRPKNLKETLERLQKKFNVRSKRDLSLLLSRGGKVIVSNDKLKVVDPRGKVEVGSGGNTIVSSGNQKLILKLKSAQKVSQKLKTKQQLKTKQKLRTLKPQATKLDRTRGFQQMKLRADLVTKQISQLRLRLKLKQSMQTRLKLKQDLALKLKLRLKLRTGLKLKQKQRIKTKTAVRLKTKLKTEVRPREKVEVEKEEEVLRKRLNKVSKIALVKQKFIYIPDLYSRVYGVKASAAEKRQLLKKGAIFSGVSIRKLV